MHASVGPDRLQAAQKFMLRIGALLRTAYRNAGGRGRAGGKDLLLSSGRECDALTLIESSVRSLMAELEGEREIGANLA